MCRRAGSCRIGENHIVGPAGTHDLLRADFDTSQGPFETGEQPDCSADLFDGTYRIISETATPDAPAWSFAWFARPAGAAQVEATIVGPGSGTVGLACLERALAGSFVGAAVALDGSRLPPIEVDGAAVRDGPGTPSVSRSPLRAGQRLGILCAYGYVRATVDGATSIDIDTPERRSGSRFDRAALLFEPDGDGDAVRFDDVDAHLPG